MVLGVPILKHFRVIPRHFRMADIKTNLFYIEEYLRDHACANGKKDEIIKKKKKKEQRFVVYAVVE